MIDDITFVHPKDMQDGKIAITSRDITTNLPYVAAAHLAFDHHESETIRNTGERKNHIILADHHFCQFETHRLSMFAEFV